MNEKEGAQEAPQKEEKEVTDIVDKAVAAAQRLEEANKKMEALLDRQKLMQAKEALGGRAEAGSEHGKEKEETPAEYAKKVMANDIKTSNP